MNKVPIMNVMRLAVILCDDGTMGIILSPEELRRETFSIDIEVLGGRTQSRNREEKVEILASPYALARSFLQSRKQPKQKGGEIKNGKSKRRGDDDYPRGS